MGKVTTVVSWTGTSIRLVFVQDKVNRQMAITNKVFFIELIFSKYSKKVINQ